MNDLPASSRDTSPPSNADQAFLDSPNALQALFDNLPVAIYLVSPDYQLITINRARSELLNKSPQILVNLPCYQALFNRTEPCPSCRLSETLAYGKSEKRFERRQSSHADSSDWEISTIPLFDHHGQITQVMLVEQDITEKRRLENILTQSEKLAIIGQLAAGIAHELNNPLTATLANAQIIQRGLEEENDLQESVELIIRASERATQVVQNLLDYARQEDFHLAPTDVHMTLQRSLDLIHHEVVSHRINVEFLPDANIPTILASEEYLQSVWLNLLMNAIDSMDKTSAQIQIMTRKLDESVQIIVCDNGKGISPDKQKSIFEPFYTTKAPGKGTGLGLSVSQRIVKQHGGSIQVKSQPGIGSEFTVTLPIILTGLPSRLA